MTEGPMDQEQLDACRRSIAKGDALTAVFYLLEAVEALVERERGKVA